MIQLHTLVCKLYSNAGYGILIKECILVACSCVCMCTDGPVWIVIHFADMDWQPCKSVVGPHKPLFVRFRLGDTESGELVSCVLNIKISHFSVRLSNLRICGQDSVLVSLTCYY